jgi:YbgC/YbaW family acyl-CoA thioester hydrolase
VEQQRQRRYAKQSEASIANVFGNRLDHAVRTLEQKTCGTERLTLTLHEVVKSAMVPRIRADVQVMFFDTDCGGVVSNIAYLRFVEIARTLLSEQLGLALVEMAQTQTYPVVVHTEIDYRRPARLGDRLMIEGWLDRVDRARFWCAFRITRPQDGILIAECRQMLALIEMPTGKLLRLPDHWKTYHETESKKEHKGATSAGMVADGECI